MADLPNPKGRRELYEYNATQGITTDMPEPKSREELYLKTLAESGGGGGGTGEVKSVNGKKGVVVLNAQDVGALPADTEIPDSTSDLNNDSGFIDNTANDLLNYYSKTETYSKSEVDTALTSKVDKVTGKGLSTNDYTDADKAEVAKVIDKADSEDVINNASYDSANHLILFKNDETTLFSLDAAAFVKDGMIDNVEITGGNLVITFNTDAGKQDISIPLTDIFDPNNYYDKDDVDGLLAPKADQTEVNSIENYYGSKNLCVYPFHQTTRTTNGITFTDNGDGTVTATGTATDNAIFHVSIRLENGKLILPNGEYKVNGCPSGGSTNSYWMVMSRTSGGTSDNYGNDTGNGMTAILNGDDYSQDNVHFQIAIIIKSGYEITIPLVFKPMVRLATIKDDTFVPYAKTNHELTVDKAEQSEVDGISNTYGAKNLLRFPYSYGTKTIAGITFTVNDDGTIIANGTATDNAIFRCSIRREGANSGDFILPNGDYILSGCTGGLTVSPYNYDLRIVVTKNGQAVANVNYDGDTPFTIDGDDASATDAGPTVQIIVRNGVTVTNKVFKPMIRLASVKDDTYQPYAITNKDLTYNNKTVTGRNLLTCPYYNTNEYTINGITFTKNADGSITANGTATEVINYRIITGIKLKGTYTLSGCINGSSTTYEMCLAVPREGNINPRQYNEPVIFSNLDGNYEVKIVVRQGAVLDNITFKPMLEEGITAHAYEPTTETALTIRNSIAPVEDGATASETRNAGEYILRNGQLHRVTQTIASGAAITEGVNIESVTVGGELTDKIIFREYQATSGRYGEISIPNIAGYKPFNVETRNYETASLYYNQNLGVYQITIITLVYNADGYYHLVSIPNTQMTYGVYYLRD